MLKDAEGTASVLCMLNPAQVKALLLHPDYDVRARASDYFKDSGTLDSEVVNLSLRALVKYNYDDEVVLGYPLVFNLRSMPAAAESVPLFLEVLRKYNSESILRDINWSVSRIPLYAWELNKAALEREEKITAVTRERIQQRKSLSKLAAEDLLDELFALSEDHCDGVLLPEATARKEDLQEALVANAYPSAIELQDLILNACEPNEWALYFLVELAGLLRMREAVPLLSEFLIDTDDDEMQEECANALSRIGDPKALEYINEGILKASWDYKLYGAGVWVPFTANNQSRLFWIYCAESVTLKRSHSYAGLWLASFPWRAFPRFPNCCPLLKLKASGCPFEVEESLLPLAMALNVRLENEDELLRRRAVRNEKLKTVQSKLELKFPIVGQIPPIDFEALRDEDELVRPEEFHMDMLYPPEQQPRPMLRAHVVVAESTRNAAEPNKSSLSALFFR